MWALFFFFFACVHVYVCVCLGLIKIHTGSCIKMLAKVLQMVTLQIYLILATRNKVNTDVLP